MRRALAACLLLVAGGCSDGGGDGRPPEPIVYVAVGASDSVGVGADDPASQAWPEVFRKSLPATTTFTNVAVSGATTEDALRDQVPKAVALEPDLVTVWLNVNDLRRLVPPDAYGDRLTRLVRQLRRGGETTVLVANTPELDSLPAFRAGPLAGVGSLVEAQVDRYTEEIDDVVDAEGAVLVDLHGPSERAEADGTFASLVSADGFHPNAAGYARVAASFADAFETTDLAG